MNLQIKHKDYHKWKVNFVYKFVIFKYWNLCDVNCITYTNWSIKLPKKLGGGPTNLFPEKSLFKIK
jgi:hypothetical protein